VQVLAVDSQKSTMRVGAGMTVGELLNAATQAGMSVQVRSQTACANLDAKFNRVEFPVVRSS
jgi:FAD/FMN-containing dehydrogenase